MLQLAVGPEGLTYRVGGSTMHPLSGLQEAGLRTHSQVAGLLASNVVLHSAVFVRTVVGRDKVVAVVAAVASLRRGAYTTEHRLDDRTTLLRWTGTIEGHEIESLEVVVEDDQGLIVDWTAALRPYPAVRVFREALYPILKDVLPADVWEYPDVSQDRKLHWVMEAGNRFGFLSCRRPSSELVRCM